MQNNLSNNRSFFRVCFSWALFHESELELVCVKLKHSLCDYNLVLFLVADMRQVNDKKIIFFFPPPFVDPFNNEGPFICQRERASGTKFS